MDYLPFSILAVIVGALIYLVDKIMGEETWLGFLGLFLVAIFGFPLLFASIVIGSMVVFDKGFLLWVVNGGWVALVIFGFLYKYRKDVGKWIAEKLGSSDK